MIAVGGRGKLRYTSFGLWRAAHVLWRVWHRVSTCVPHRLETGSTHMIDFIAEIGTYARQRNPDFLVIQQNAAALIEGHPDLVDEIDAIAQEGVWYDGVAGDDWDDVDGYFFNEEDLTAEYLAFLDQYLDAGIPVFNCEYALAEDADDAYARSLAEGYVPYVTKRSLSRLTDTLPQPE